MVSRSLLVLTLSLMMLHRADASSGTELIVSIPDQTIVLGH